MFLGSNFHSGVLRTIVYYQSSFEVINMKNEIISKVEDAKMYEKHNVQYAVCDLKLDGHNELHVHRVGKMLFLTVYNRDDNITKISLSHGNPETVEVTNYAGEVE